MIAELVVNHVLAAGGANIPTQCGLANAVAPFINIVVGNLKGFALYWAPVVIVALVALLVPFAVTRFRRFLVSGVVWTLSAVVVLGFISTVLVIFVPNTC